MSERKFNLGNIGFLFLLKGNTFRGRKDYVGKFAFSKRKLTEREDSSKEKTPAEKNTS